jgi:hypothetical protein
MRRHNRRVVAVGRLLVGEDGERCRIGLFVRDSIVKYSTYLSG